VWESECGSCYEAIRDGGLLQRDSVIHGQKEDDIGELTSLGRDDAAREEED
jgi:hypothetical protein